MSNLLERVLRDQGRDREAISNIKEDVIKLEQRLASIETKLDELIALVNQGKGGYKTAAWIIGSVTFVVGAIASLISWLRH